MFLTTAQASQIVDSQPQESLIAATLSAMLSMKYSIAVWLQKGIIFHRSRVHKSSIWVRVKCSPSEKGVCVRVGWRGL